MAGEEQQTLSVLLELRDRMTGLLTRPIGQIQGMSKAWATMSAASAKAALIIKGSIALMGRAITQEADELVRLSNITGIGTEKLQELGMAAKLNSSSIQEMAVGLRHLARSATEAFKGNDSADEMFLRLGVSVRDANGSLKGTEQLFREVADGIAEVGNPTERAALAMEVFGRAGTNLLPLLSEGAAGFDKVGKITRELGIVMGDDAVRGLEAFGDQMTVLKEIGKELMAQFLLQLSELLPDIITYFLEFTKVISAIKDTVVLLFNQMLVGLEAVGNAIEGSKKFLRGDFFGAAQSFSKVWTDSIKNTMKNTQAWENGLTQTVASLDKFRDKVLEALRAVKAMGSAQSGAGSGLFSLPHRVWERFTQGLERAQENFNKTGDTIGFLEEKIKLTQKAIVDMQAALKESDGDTPEYKNHINELRKALDNLNEGQRVATDLLLNFKKIMKDIRETAEDAGLDLTSQQLQQITMDAIDGTKSVNKWMEELIRARDENPMTGLVAAMKEFVKYGTDFRQIFGQAFLAAESAFSDMVAGIIEGGRRMKDLLASFFNDIKRSFIRMVSDIIAQQAMKQIIGLFLPSGTTNVPVPTGQSFAPTPGSLVPPGTTPGSPGSPGVPGAPAVLAAGLSVPSMLAMAGIPLGLSIAQQGMAEGDRASSAFGGGLSGAGLGFMVGGPIGAAIGLFAGGGLGFLGGSKAKREEEKAKEEAEEQQAEAERQLDEQRKKAATLLKTSIRSQMGGGLATPEAVGAISQLMSGDITADDIANLSPSALQGIMGSQGDIEQLAANQQITVGAPVISVSVGQIASSYDAQRLAEDLGFHFAASLQAAAAGGV